MILVLIDTLVASFSHTSWCSSRCRFSPSPPLATCHHAWGWGVERRDQRGLVVGRVFSFYFQFRLPLLRQFFFRGFSCGIQLSNFQPIPRPFLIDSRQFLDIVNYFMSVFSWQWEGTPSGIFTMLWLFSFYFLLEFVNIVHNTETVQGLSPKWGRCWYP